MEVKTVLDTQQFEDFELSRNMGKTAYATLMQTVAAKMSERMQRESDKISGSVFFPESGWLDSAWTRSREAQIRDDWKQVEAALQRANATPLLIEEYVPAAPAAGPSEEYRAKLKAIGATALLSKLDADVECASFIEAVKMRGLRFYRKDNIERYLIAEASKVNAGQWGVEWTPLARYTQAIPSPVIDTMIWVKEEFPSATFSISEVKRYPDPFLMVTLHGREYIIEKWDEPGYREE